MNQKGVAPLIVVGILGIAAIISFAGYFAWKNSAKPNSQSMNNISATGTEATYTGTAHIFSSSTTNAHPASTIIPIPTSSTVAENSTTTLKAFEFEKYGYAFALPQSWQVDNWTGGLSIDGPVELHNYDRANYGEISPNNASIDITTDFLPTQPLWNYITDRLHLSKIISSGTVLTAGMPCIRTDYDSVLGYSTTTVSAITAYCQGKNLLYEFYLSHDSTSSVDFAGIFQNFLSSFKFIPGVNYVKPLSGQIKALYQKNGHYWVDVHYVRFLTGSDADRYLQENGCPYGSCTAIDGLTSATSSMLDETLPIADDVKIQAPDHCPGSVNICMKNFTLAETFPSSTYGSDLSTFWWFTKNANGTVVEMDRQYTP